MPKMSETYKEERRTHLVSAAERVFLRQGYVHTTVQDIMTEADVSRGGFYLYFGNKAEIFEAVLDRQDQRLLTALAKVRESSDPIGPAILALAPETRAMEAEDRRRVAMVVEFHLEHRDDPGFRQRLLNRLDRLEGALEAVLQEGVDRGEFQPALPLKTIVAFFVSAQDGWSIHMAVRGDRPPAGVEFAEGFELFLRYSLGMTP